jgi:SAM-dependent methyltransferase
MRNCVVATNLAHQQSVREHYRSLAPVYNGRANQTCERAYFRLVSRVLANCQSVLELGSGSSDLLDRLNPPFSVACDLSADMLRMRPGGGNKHGVVAAGERLPFAAGQFQGVFLINVLEHVTSVAQVLRECARVLEKNGILLAVTPNGDWERWLDLAERWAWKLPEGPHVFLTRGFLREAVEHSFAVIEHRTFLLFPAGPHDLARLLDRVSLCNRWGGGFFQFIVARKRRMSPKGTDIAKQQLAAR